jgi:hypothetical protein
VLLAARDVGEKIGLQAAGWASHKPVGSTRTGGQDGRPLGRTRAAADVWRNSGGPKHDAWIIPQDKVAREQFTDTGEPTLGNVYRFCVWTEWVSSCVPAVVIASIFSKQNAIYVISLKPLK